MEIADLITIITEHTDVKLTPVQATAFKEALIPYYEGEPKEGGWTWYLIAILKQHGLDDREALKVAQERYNPKVKAIVTTK